MALFPERRLDRELIDGPALAHDALAKSLDQVAAANRWLGGERSLRRHLAHLRHEDIRLLDVGTGNGWVLRRLLSWARAGGGRWRGVGLDLHPQVIAIARGAPGDDDSRLVRGDARHLPFASDSFDVAICTLTLHHFTDEDAVQLMAELGRVARRLVLVSDLERQPLAYLSARVLALTWWRTNPFTRFDGPLSVLRSFTPGELKDLGRRSGLEGVLVRRHFPFRLMLEGRP
jgi:ubiquinone/menaquinone biosynthesis C-methylase UbiE